MGSFPPSASRRFVRRRAVTRSGNFGSLGRRLDLATSGRARWPCLQIGQPPKMGGFALGSLRHHPTKKDTIEKRQHHSPVHLPLFGVGVFEDRSVAGMDHCSGCVSRYASRCLRDQASLSLTSTFYLQSNKCLPLWSRVGGHCCVNRMGRSACLVDPPNLSWPLGRSHIISASIWLTCHDHHGHAFDLTHDGRVSNTFPRILGIKHGSCYLRKNTNTPTQSTGVHANRGWLDIPVRRSSSSHTHRADSA